jgi:hypothetical protein
MAKSRMARVGARPPCSGWGRDIDSIDGMIFDGIMKAVPSRDRLFFFRLLVLYPALYCTAKIESGHPARKAGCGIA